MNIRISTDQSRWNSFIQKRSHASFLQSWEWGEFQQAAGHVPLRLEIVDNKEVKECIHGFVHQLVPGFRYLYSPRLFLSDTSRYNSDMVAISKHIKKLGFIFWRVEPVHELSSIIYPLSQTHNRQPQDTLLLDLSLSLDELLQQMHPKTRYNIGLAERKGVMLRQEKQPEIFWQLNEETIERDGFRSHGEKYYEQMLRIPITYQYTAWVGDTPVASNICIGFGDTFTYLHGASGNAHRNVMAPYVLQWYAMQEAKRLGFRYYDVGGIAPRLRSPSQSGSYAGQAPNNQRITYFHNYSWDATHPFTGITRFKAGFGGTPVHYPDAGEVVCRPFLYSVYKKIRNFR